MTLKIDDIIEIHKKIKPQIRWTETSYSQSISEKTNSNIYIKYENRQHTGSFKARGSFAKLASLSELEKRNGVIAMSAGNHAQGLAYSASKNNIKSNIVMPTSTPFTKIRRTKNFGGKVILKGESLQESFSFVQKLVGTDMF